VYHILSREPGEADLLVGRIDEQKTRQLLATVLPAAQVDECFICGPEDMVLGVKAALTSAGVAPEKIHFELFGPAGGGKKVATAALPRPAGEDDKRSQVTVQLDGGQRVLAMSYYGNTILDALLETGVDAPYSCKNGMCSTCRARVLVGEVAMDVNYSLSDTEVAKGYVLTCQARPTSAQVTVDFDQ
jgi:ring-1,2-phenylacetyl-CoA epoxidase subunit PaaE